MRLALRIVVLVIALVVIAPVVALIGLNTAGGRDFAVAQINHFGSGQIVVSGLRGHFPADIKISKMTVLDRNGAWLRGDDLELRWVPLQILWRNLHVIALTARDISVLRTPDYGGGENGAKSRGGFPLFRLAADHVAIGALNLPASLAGETVQLAVTGEAHFRNAAAGDATLSAVAANSRGTYLLNAAINDEKINTTLHVQEPPDGLLGHFVGPTVRAPLQLDMTLAGPRDHAKLDFAASMGEAHLNGAGMLDLNPEMPKADMVFTVPALAPLGALAGQKLGGTTTLHLVTATQPDQSTTMALDGALDLTAAPAPAARLIGAHGQIAIRVSLAHQMMTIQKFSFTGDGVQADVSGTARLDGGVQAVNLNTHLALHDVAAISPGITGVVTADGNIIGNAADFSVTAQLDGDIAKAGTASGPFHIAINARHLPMTPSGVVSATGALENAPLTLDATFAKDEAGRINVTIDNAAWRSLSAAGTLALAPGADLPTGTANFAVGQLADVSAFSPVKLAGSAAGSFAHNDGGDFALSLTARHLLVSRAAGPVDANLSAHGKVSALAVKFNASLTKVFAFPARIDAALVLDLDNRSGTVSALSASWHGLNAVLQGPAAMQTRPGLAIRHLALALNPGTIRLDGALTPTLHANFSVDNLPARIAGIFAPAIQANGTLTASGSLTGTARDPAGRLTLNARAIHLQTGPAASLAPAYVSADAAIANHAAVVHARLTAGPNLDLNAAGTVPLNQSGAIDLHVAGQADLRLADPILAESGTILRGVVTPDVTITGQAAAPRVNGTMTLANGSLENIGTGLNLVNIGASVAGNGNVIMLRNFSAGAGAGTITGNGTVDLGKPGDPVDLDLAAANATPISSDIVTETLDAALRLHGELRGAMALSGDVTIDKANINIPKSLPPTVANLPIVNRGAPVPPVPPAPPPVALDLLIRANNQIFVRGDGLFAELGGRLHVTGTADDPDPEGGFTLIRGDFSLAGKDLQFSQGTVSFNGAGFMPALDLEATTSTPTMTATLVVGGTAAAPTITLTSTPPAPSDAILAQLLFGTGTQNLTAFQAASLAAALAQLSGVGGGNPLDSVRNALGLDQLSLGGTGSGPPSVQAGRYIAPGVYVGATQATNGQGTQATVEINLYKGLKLDTATGTGSSGAGNASSVGLTYQFNY